MNIHSVKTQIPFNIYLAYLKIENGKFVIDENVYMRVNIRISKLYRIISTYMFSKNYNSGKDETKRSQYPLIEENVRK